MFGLYVMCNFHPLEVEMNRGSETLILLVH